MLKGFVSKDYAVLVIIASLIVILLLGVGFTSRQATGRAGCRRSA